MLASSSLYAAHFAPLVEHLPSLQSVPATEDDLLGAGPPSGWRTLFGAALPLQERANLFSLSTRQGSLRNLDHGLDFPTSGHHPFELLYRSIHFQFVTAALQEGRFCRAIFGAPLTDRVFAPTASLLAVRTDSSSQCSTLIFPELAARFRRVFL